MKNSILSDPDKNVRFAALKRIHLFKAHPNVVPFLQSLDASKDKRSLEPYLSMALHRMGLITLEVFEKRIHNE